MSPRTTSLLVSATLLVTATSSLYAQQTPPVSLTLDKALQMAEAYAPMIKQAEADLKAQDLRTTSTYLNLGPKLTGDYNHAIMEKEKVANFGGAEIVISPKESRTASLTLVQPIAGLVGLAYLASFENRTLNVQEYKTQLTKETIRFQTAELYLLAQSSETMLKVAEEGQAAAKRQVGDALSLFKAGRIHRGDLLKLELAYSNATAEVARARAAKVRIHAQLLGFIGLPLETDLRFPTTEIVAREPANLTTDAALEKRKDILAAREGAVLASYQKDLARIDFYPSINAFGKIDYNLGEPAGIGGGEKKSMTYGLQASWQLWNNGSNVYKYREAAYKTRSAEEGLKTTLDQARIDIIGAKADLVASKESMQLARTALNQAREAQRIEQAKFKSGNSSATELVLAETSRTQAEGNVVAVSADLQIKILKLQKAYGMEKPEFQEGK